MHYNHTQTWPRHSVIHHTCRCTCRALSLYSTSTVTFTFVQKSDDVLVLGEAAALAALGVHGQQRVHGAVIACAGQGRVHRDRFLRAQGRVSQLQNSLVDIVIH